MLYMINSRSPQHTMDRPYGRSWTTCERCLVLIRPRYVRHIYIQLGRQSFAHIAQSLKSFGLNLSQLFDMIGPKVLLAVALCAMLAIDLSCAADDHVEKKPDVTSVASSSNSQHSAHRTIYLASLQYIE